mgnify:CR=1 FL=1
MGHQFMGQMVDQQGDGHPQPVAAHGGQPPGHPGGALGGRIGSDSAKLRTRLTSLVSILALGTLLGATGCVHRELVGFEDHASKPLTAMRVAVSRSYVFWSSHEYVFYSCAEQGDKLTCNLHGWQWDLASGRCLTSKGHEIRAEKLVTES